MVPVQSTPLFAPFLCCDVIADKAHILPNSGIKYCMASLTSDECISQMASSIDQRMLLFKMEGNYLHIGYQFK